ncbi:hypothetical protein [Sporolactobacillus laevolacticus]|uniref:Uncharacterized protein n=1 Tax=Sporolactobacillus laevolacticus DSM 442 TaxID=1395513 RepID=V6J1D6_9BACL|nr:hypothetical protein [Sporolactobacillus laevolacticus]EST13698.1 hypothetical protein P343_01615 [Sporolactobacillus laevolacticus DSM 442]
MLDELQKLVGKTFKPHELDDLCAKITGGQKEFRRLYWEDIVGLENMSYPTKLGVTYVVEFNLYKDEGEYDSIIEVWEVNELDRNAHNRNFDKLYLILIAVLIFAVSIYYLFSFFH